MTSELDPLLIDRAGLERLLQLSRRELYRLEDAGRLLAPVLVGASKRRPLKRWSIEEIEEWVRAGCPERRAWENLRSVSSAPGAREAGH